MIRTVPRDSYDLTARDDAYLYAAVRLEPRALMRGLLALRFADAATRFPDDASLAAASKEIARQASFVFEKHARDVAALHAFLQMPEHDPLDVLLAFRTLWRGYEDADFTRALARIEDDRREIEDALEDAKLQNTRSLRRTPGRSGRGKTRKDQAKHRAHLRISQALRGISRDVARAFADPAAMAHAKLAHEVAYRRTRAPRLWWPPSGDYTGFLQRIRDNDPKSVGFPLRHMTLLIAGDYHELLDRWLAGASREEIVLALDSEIRGRGSGVEDRLRELEVAIRQVFVTNRSGSLEELRVCVDHNCHLATTLVAMTQVEGLLWDLAECVNGNRMPIYFKTRHREPRRLPYAWNFAKEEYKFPQEAAHRLRPKGKELLSATALLNQTRLGTIVPFELYSYLADDFAQARNPLAHGSIANRNLHVDAVAAVVCLWCVMEFIHEHLFGKDMTPGAYLPRVT